MMILKSYRPRESHQAKGKPTNSRIRVVIPASFKVSQMGERSISWYRIDCFMEAGNHMS